MEKPLGSVKEPRAQKKQAPGGGRGLSRGGVSVRVWLVYSSDRFWKRLRMYTASEFMERSMTSSTMIPAAASD